ncbi:MAG: FxDxF family PEP-CTERM protein [Betaproteobacteria bacterium]
MSVNLGLGSAIKSAALGVALVLASAGVQAQSYQYEFGYQLAHPTSTVYQPSGTFATMSVTSYDSIHYRFDLQALPTFGSLFNNANASIGGVVFNTPNAAPVVDSVQLASGTWGVGSIWHLPYSFQLGGIAFDFTEALTGNGFADSHLSSGERVVWETTFAQPTTFAAPPFAVKVFGIGANDSAYAFYAPTSVSPIPEPETYGMLLAGLGMLGFAARRRKQKEAAAA